jgi:hypothetical protein
MPTAREGSATTWARMRYGGKASDDAETGDSGEIQVPRPVVCFGDCDETEGLLKNPEQCDGVVKTPLLRGPLVCYRGWSMGLGTKRSTLRKLVFCLLSYWKPGHCGMARLLHAQSQTKFPRGSRHFKSSLNIVEVDTCC